mgnify:CR=1 FL=1
MKEIKNLLNNKKEINGFEVKKNNDNYFTLSKENEEMSDIFIYNNFISIESLTSKESEEISSIEELNNFLENNCFTFEELQENIKQANINSNMAWDHILKHEKTEFMNEYLNYKDSEDLLNMAFFGNYNPTHEFLGYDGNGNIESMTKEQYHNELLKFQDEIIQDLQD